MELYQDMILRIYQEKTAGLDLDIKKIMEMKCYQALAQIRTVLNDEQLNDADCFKQIEEIVCIFESLGSNGGRRHDFG